MNTYALIRSADISRFAILKAPATAILIFSVLSRYASDKVSCFPSIATIGEALGNAYNERTIYKGLAWLCKHRFIERKNCRSKERFTILSRLAQKTAKVIEKIVEAGEKVVKTAMPDKAIAPALKEPHKKIRKKNHIYNKKNNHNKRGLPEWRYTSNYERWERPPETTKTDAETAWRDLCLLTHPPDLSKASMAQKESIIRGILHTKELNWVLDVYPDILKEEKTL